MLHKIISSLYSQDSWFKPSFFMSGGGSLDYEIENSLRFRSAASAYLNRAPGTSPADQTRWTLSVWVKRGVLSAGHTILGGNSGTAAFTQLGFEGDDTIRFSQRNSSSVMTADFKTTSVFRDPSAWYHIVFVYDTNAAATVDRLKFYVNSIRQPVTQTTNPTLGLTPNGAFFGDLRIGNARTTANINHFDGYMANIHMIDGQTLEPTDFGKIDSSTGSWIPKKYTGSYGTHSFWLGFKKGANISQLGTDTAYSEGLKAENNFWTVNNFSLTDGETYDWMEDTPTNNFAVLNPLNAWFTYAVTSYSNLRLNANTSGSTAGFSSYGSIEAHSDKYYFEAVLSSYSGSSNLSLGVGSNPNNSYASLDVSTNGTYMAAVDIDNQLAWFGTNGVWTGDPVAGTGGTSISILTGTLTFYVRDNSGSASNGGVWDANFGQRPFIYTMPIGFKKLCAKNLTNPVIKNSSKYFDILLYAGNGDAPQSIQGLEFQPDLISLKSRSTASSGIVVDSVRGRGFHLSTNLTNAEAIDGETAGITSIDSNGFSVDDDPVGYGSSNDAANNYVAWCWKKDPLAGVDIQTYTGTGVARTVAHDLGAVPSMMIVKKRGASTATGWYVYHKNLASNRYALYLNTTDAQDGPFTVFWNDTTPTETEFTVGTSVGVNESAIDYVAYLFAEVPGFSKFGSYTGNGSTDGPFIWCGFKPRWILLKRSSAVGDWLLLDTERDTNNTTSIELYPHLSNAEGDNLRMDILSNGFKIRESGVNSNQSGATVIFAAFAECPFKYANAI